jgi:hypothetical protein
MRLLPFLLLVACSGATTGFTLPDLFPGDTDDDVPPDDTEDTDGATPAERGLVINEFVASNESGATDEAGEFDDWVELYNAGDAEVNLDGWELADSGGQGFELPVRTLAAGAHLLVWCDSQPDQGPLHATFNLGRGGDALVLTAPDGDLADRVTWGNLDTGGAGLPEQTTDVSSARLPDGGPWGEDTTPTPGAPNDG